MVVILQIQNARHNMLGESGSYQKLKAKGMGSMWKKCNAFVQNIHIRLKSGTKLPNKICKPPKQYPSHA